MKKRILILILAIAAGAYAIWQYQIHSALHPSTEDAYLDADVVRVAPRVSGRVDTLKVSNQQRVNNGDLLLSIDPTPFRFAVQQARAQLALAQRQVSQAQAAVTSNKAGVHNRQVLLANADTKLKRAQRLAKQKFISDENVTNAEADYKSAEANLQLAQAQLEETRTQLGSPGDKNDRIMQASATLDQALWELDNTRVKAACTGQISELILQPGNVVSADKPVFVLVCNDHYWIEANFKETQLEYIRAGQPVSIQIDMYPNHQFHGVVESINAASGSAFSLLPPQNANGNWVKVTQRVPVRIKLDNPGPEFPLLLGTSSIVTIDTTRSAAAQKQLTTNAQ